MDGPQQNPSAIGPIAAGVPNDANRAGQYDRPNPTMEHPLRPIIAQWIEKIRIAQEYKTAKFGEDAEECMAFFNGPYDFMYQKKYMANSRAFSLTTDAEDEMPAPTFQMTVNKVAEAVQIFGPALYARNPVRQVNPRVLPQLPMSVFGNPQDPMAQMMAVQAQQTTTQMQTADQARASLLQFYLNYTPVELELLKHSRRAIDEAVIKGMGLLWTEMYQPKGATFKLVGSFYDTVDNLVIDPDVETIEDCKWIARKCTHPIWEVEREYGLPEGSLRGNLESIARQSEVNVSPDGDYDRKRGTTNDLIVYWKIWSKMGVGGRLQGAPQELRQVLEQFGDFCYLVVAEHTPYPLNLPPEMIASADPQAPEQILTKLDWPIPYYLDDEWPCTPFVFHEVPRCVWPMSHMKPAMGELKFLNWAYSFLASKIRVTCRDFIAMKKSLGEELKDAILHGKDLTLLEIEQAHGTISECVQFLTHPSVNGDVWKVIEAIEQNFEKRTGLNDLLYGESQHQMRSAEEASLKNQNLQVRPEDMANRVEDAMSKAARKEALAARWFLRSQDVQEVMGPVAAYYWDQFVVQADVYAVVRQLEYRIEAGSTRKPNRDRDTQNMQQAINGLFQPLFQYAEQTGNVGPVNALISDWAKTLDMDPSRYLLQPPPPPQQPQQQPGQAPRPGGQRPQPAQPQPPAGGPPQGGGQARAA